MLEIDIHLQMSVNEGIRETYDSQSQELFSAGNG